KALFQLRIVDRYGLAPGQPTLGLRMVSQLLPVWGSDLWLMLSEQGAARLATALIVAVLAAVSTDVVFALFRRDGRSLHDLLLGTKVVLDTRTDGTAE
ncbi:MAG TPA: hypothetical protein VF170_00720, partial [Planctomycetaceae bacterium]